MKKNKVAALLGLLGVFLSSGLKSSGMENNNLVNQNDENNSSFFSKILDYWPFPVVLTVGGGLKKMLSGGNVEIGYEDVDYSNPKYTQTFIYPTQCGIKLELTPGDQNWIDRNVLLLDQKEGSSYCWHNASMNYIFAPEFMNMTGLPKKIKIMTDWGKEQLKKKSNRANDFLERLSGAVEVPRAIRQLPDKLDTWLDGSDNIDINRGKPFMFNNASGMGSHTGGKEITFGGVNIKDIFTNIQCDKCSDWGVNFDDDSTNAFTARVADLTKGFTLSFVTPKEDYEEGKNVLWWNSNDGKGLKYYPTCVVVNQFGTGHYTTFYFVYGQNGKIKFCVYLDGNAGNYQLGANGNAGNYQSGAKGIQIMTYSKAVDKIRELTIPEHNAAVGVLGGGLQGAYHVRYSTEDIVKKYYTPED